jgi:hypothetical protein
MTELAAGLVVELAGQRHFVPAAVALRVVRRPIITKIPGATLGMASIDGRIVTVIELAPGGEQLVLCATAGEDIGVSGMDVLSSGLFEREGEHVRFGDDLVATLDVDAALHRAESQLYRGRITNRGTS